MARLKEGIGGGFSGKIGNIVGVQLHGKNIIRSLPSRSKKAPTPKQKLQRAKFAKAVEFLNPVRNIVSEFFGSAANAKLRYHAAHSWITNQAVSIVNGTAEIMPSRVLFSKGELLQMAAGAYEITTDNRLRITWNDNSAEGNAMCGDKLHIILYQNKTFSRRYFPNIAVRENRTVEIEIPDINAGDGWVVYVFFQSEGKNGVSTTQFLGEI